MRRPRGLGLVEVLIAAALVAVVAFSVSKMMSGMGRNVASMTQRTDTEEIRLMLQRRLNCRATFPGGACPPMVGNRGQVILRDNNGNEIFTDYDDTDAGVTPNKAVFRNSYRWGTSSARIRTQCGPNRLDVSVVSYNQPEKAWPPVAPIQVCQEVLGGPPPACPPNEAALVIEGVTRCTTRQSVCESLGYAWNAANSTCSPPAPFLCALFGYAWNGGTNRCQPPSDMVCALMGYTWNAAANRCQPPSDLLCTLVGYTWNAANGTCTPPRSVLCSSMGYNYDAKNGLCYPPVDNVFGGAFQRGENPVAGPPDCETANPKTGSCTCPPGFTAYDTGYTVEPNKMWDGNFMCLRSN